MSVRLLKCYGTCEEKYPADELVKVGGQNHCSPCAAVKEKEKKDRDILYTTIQKVYNLPYPNGQMLRQIKQFAEVKNYTLEGMTMTIYYFVTIQKKTPFTNGGLSFVPFHYDNAVKYYRELKEKRANTGEVKDNLVQLKISPIKHTTESFRQKKMVTMGAILNDK